MRDAEFRAWLDKRFWRGVPLTPTAKDSRFRRILRVERGLAGLGFVETTLEAVFDTDQWDRLLSRLTDLRDDPAADAAAARSVVPEAKDPTGQLGNLLAAVTQYGHFLEGRDPNYGTSDDSDFDDALGLTRESVEAVLREYDQSGNGFMQKYGFAANFDYVVYRPGETERYPAKAVFLVAYSSIPGNPDITAKGQRDTIRDAVGGPIHSEFRRLGYEIENRRQGSKEVQANRIREHLIAHYIEPARRRGDPQVTIRAGDVHKELRLSNQLPNVCQAIEGERLREATGLDKPEIISGPASGRGGNMVYRFALTHGQSAQRPLSDEQIMARFDGNPDFQARRSAWSSEQRAAFCRMARAVNAVGLDWYHTDIPQIRFGRKSSQVSRAEGTLGSLQFRMAGPFLTFSHQNGLLGLAGDHSFDAESADRFATAIADAQEAVRTWLPNSPERPGKWPDAYGRSGRESNESDAMKMPTNLILYGPPGTGKTYNTALEAVALCDGQAYYPTTKDGRAALMTRYNELVGQERIAFVTFHQNYGYEDFVEGLRPSTFGEDGQPLASGFRLAPEAGIFTKIAERAEALRSARDDGYDFSGKRFFKMSLGEVANPEDDYLFEEAIEGGFVHLGDDGGMDWSQPTFTTKESMIAGYAERHPDEAVPHPNNGIIEFPFRLRVRARVGDIVIVSKGNLLFRAIGEITGEYHQVKRENDDYSMRRSVKWLWIDRDGVSHDVIYGKRFSQRTIYEFPDSELKLDAIRGLIEVGRGGADEGPAKQFVLIIDEINRANVSKVFGELITLLEQDKRAGMDNALSVTLPYSKRQFSVPANLHIIGTMNTADRSIALLDTALRRRFNFREMTPDPGLLAEASKRTGINLVRVLTTINQRIEYLIDREHRIGHAFLIGCETIEQVHAAMRDKVIPLLQEYFFEDWSRIAAVLGDGFIWEDKLDPPPGIEGDRLSSWSVLSPFKPDAFDRLVGKAAGAVEEPSQ